MTFISMKMIRNAVGIVITDLDGVILFANALVRLVDVGIFVSDWTTALGELWRGLAVVVLSTFKGLYEEQIDTLEAVLSEPGVA